jgi:hypothetical protein
MPLLADFSDNGLWLSSSASQQDVPGDNGLVNLGPFQISPCFERTCKRNLKSTRHCPSLPSQKPYCRGRSNQLAIGSRCFGAESRANDGQKKAALFSRSQAWLDHYI